MKTDAPKKRQSEIALLLTLADTTWRMVVPTILFVAVGIFLDLRFSTMPWLTLVGLVIGFAVAIKLVLRQIARADDL